MSRDEQNKRFNLVVENAFDFLFKAIDELKEKPKYSVIHFHAAVELFLKARLMAEHWSLVIAPRCELNWDKFISGDFQSVSLSDAASRLDKVVKCGLSNDEIAAFKGIAKHRNKIIHFYHEAHSPEESLDVKQQITKEQLQAWYFLNTLLSKKWKDTFIEHQGKIVSVEKALRKHREFLTIVFDSLKETIENKKHDGFIFMKCPSCDFEAQENINEPDILYRAECLVCGFVERVVQVVCTNCDGKVYFRNDGTSFCDNCGKKYTPEDLAGILDKSAYDDYYTLGNCSYCDGWHTVVEYGDGYLCCGCLEEFDTLSQCEWCSENYTGHKEFTYLTGCVVCDGKGGWEKDD